MGSYGELQYQQHRALGEETYHAGTLLSLPKRFPSVPARQKHNSSEAAAGLGCSQITLQTTPFANSTRPSCSILEKSEPRIPLLFSEPAFKDTEKTFFFFLGRTVNRMKDLGERLKT